MTVLAGAFVVVLGVTLASAVVTRDWSELEAALPPLFATGVLLLVVWVAVLCRSYRRGRSWAGVGLAITFTAGAASAGAAALDTYRRVVVDRTAPGWHLAFPTALLVLASAVVVVVAIGARATPPGYDRQDGTAADSTTAAP